MHMYNEQIFLFFGILQKSGSQTVSRDLREYSNDLLALLLVVLLPFLTSNVDTVQNTKTCMVGRWL